MPATLNLPATSRQLLRTPRVVLRTWRSSDLLPFRALNADPDVMAEFPSVLTAEESDRLAFKAYDDHERDGFGLWVLELPGVADFAGIMGFNRPAFRPDDIEIVWRLERRHWSQGYAREAARAALTAVLSEREPAVLTGLPLPVSVSNEILEGVFTQRIEEVVAFTAATNRRSIRLMNNLSMTHDPADDFLHPAMPPDHRLARHVLYRLKRHDWMMHGETRIEPM